MSEPAAETPWDVVKRMRAEGQTREAITARLTAMGLEPDDIKVLLMEEPPKGGSGIDVGPVAAAAAVLVAGPILGGLALAAMGDRVAEREEAGPQAPLGAADTSTSRCAVHPELASVGTCPRCGKFACRGCAPREGFAKNRLCASCEQQPSVREGRVITAARGVSLTVFSFVGLLLVEFLGAMDSQKLWVIALGFGVFAAPFGVLGLLQLFVRSRWPGIVAAVCAIGFLVFVVATGGFDALMLLWLVAFAVLVAMLSAMGTARKAWRG